MTFIEPLDIEYLFVNTFSGNLTIFTLIMVMVITYMCAKFKMENISFMIMLALFAGIMLAVGDSALIILMILVLSPILFWIIRRTVE